MDMTLVKIHSAYKKHSTKILGTPFGDEYNQLGYCSCGIFYVTQEDRSYNGYLYNYASGSEGIHLDEFMLTQPVELQKALAEYRKVLKEYQSRGYGALEAFLKAL